MAKLGEYDRERHGDGPLITVYRDTTRCRQYCFYSADDLRRWADRHPYKNETVRVMVWCPEKIAAFSAPATEAGDIAESKILTWKEQRLGEFGITK